MDKASCLIRTQSSVVERSPIISNELLKLTGRAFQAGLGLLLFAVVYEFEHDVARTRANVRRAGAPLWWPW